MSTLFDYQDSDLSQNVRTKHPEFSDIEHTDFDTILRYSILMYDLESEMREIHKDYATRKRECAVLAGWKIQKNRKFAKEVEDILVGTDPQANKIIASYIRTQNNPDFLLYVSYSELLSKEVENAQSEKDPKIIKFIQGNIDKLGAGLARLNENIFGGREVELMRRQLYMTLVVEGSILRPESVAKMISEGKLALGDDPYYSR